MGMVFAHHFSNDSGALPRAAIRQQTHLLHRVEDSAVDRLQSVANIGERAANDHRHRIVEVRPLHLLFDIDGLNVRGARDATVAGRRSQGKFRVLIVCHEMSSL